MIRYETLILAVPEITNDEAATIEKTLAAAINQVQGNVISFERWGKFKLAYQINKNDYGVYYLVRYEVSNENKTTLANQIQELFTVRLNTLVMRHMTSILDARKGLEYTRPQSLEEAPEVDTTTMRESTGSWGRQRSYEPRSFEQAPRAVEQSNEDME